MPPKKKCALKGCPNKVPPRRTRYCSASCYHVASKATALAYGKSHVRRFSLPSAAKRGTR